LGLLRAPTQSCAQEFDHLERDFRLLAHQWQKIPALDNEQFAVGQRGGVCGTGMAVQECDFTDDRALTEHISYGIMAID
jgi:hypothetical protein